MLEGLLKGKRGGIDSMKVFWSCFFLIGIVGFVSAGNFFDVPEFMNGVDIGIGYDINYGLLGYQALDGVCHFRFSEEVMFGVFNVGGKK